MRYLLTRQKLDASAGPTLLRPSRFALSLLVMVFGAAGAGDTHGLERSTLVFGGDRANPPYEWLDGDTARGFSVELARAIAEAGGVKAEHRLTTWPEALKALESGTVDVVTMYRTPEREERFLFTPPFHFVHHAIYGRPDSQSVIAIGDLDGQRVAVEKGSYVERRLEREGHAVDLVETTNTDEALHAISDRRADYAVLSTEIAGSVLSQQHIPVVRLSPPLWSLGFAFAVPKENEELANWLTERYYEVIRKGIYEDLYSRWENQLDPRTKPSGDYLLEFVVTLSGGLALLGIGIALRLRKAVVLKSRALQEEANRRQMAEHRLHWLSEHDSDTDFPRLSHFAAQVESLLANGAPHDAERQVVALKVADVDKTSLVEGHEAGIKLIRDFAHWLQSMDFEAYGQDGKDVFLVFGDKRNVLSKLASIVSHDDTAILQLSHSKPRFFAGAATWNDRSTTLTELLRQSSTALAKAIEDRQPWVDYRPSMEPDKNDLQLIEIFRESAGRDIYPLFQPQIDLGSGDIVGAEALVRWNAPGIGAVSPAKFIPLIEDAGLIRFVTRRMIRDAVRVGSYLRNRGFPCPVSVNMSISDVLSPNFLTKIEETVQAYDGRPEDIKLELTETNFAKHSHALFWSMMQIYEKGISISIDDFGTGYSSLSYLSDLPVSELKIDRSFIQGMREKAKNKSIVRSTIEMGHELGLIVVAEGVESETQLETLRALGCDRVQGYLIAKPMAEEQFVKCVSGSAQGKRVSC